MAYVKRLNYFRAQFLQAKDFEDEQTYHRESQHRHNQHLHTPGVAEGMGVTRNDARNVSIGSGMAIDGAGREIVFLERESVPIDTTGSGETLWLSVRFDDTFQDPADADPGEQPGQFIRKTEKPKVEQLRAATQPTDTNLVLLARITLAGDDIAEGDAAINTRVRTLAGPRLRDQSVGTAQLAANAVTFAKLSVQRTEHVVEFIGTEGFQYIRLTPSELPPPIILVQVSPQDPSANIDSEITWTEFLDKDDAGNWIHGFRFQRQFSGAFKLKCTVFSLT